MEPKEPVRFSVVIAVYNGESTVARAIESVLAQSFPAHEIIVVDDGSTDGTAERVQAFAERVVYCRQPNTGVSAARNAGVASASGNWITFLDADDWYYPERLLLHCRLLERHPELQVASGDYHCCDANGTVLRGFMESTAYGARLLRENEEAGQIIIRGEELEELITNYIGHTLSFAITKELFEHIGGFPIGYPIGEDLHLAVRACATAGTVGVVTRAMGAYVIHDAGAMRSDRMRAQRENLRVVCDLRERLLDEPAPIRRGARTLLRQARLDLAQKLARDGHRSEAIATVVPIMWESPGLHSLRDLLSVVKG